MPLQLDILHPGFAARAGGIDLGQPLDLQTVAGLKAALDEFPVLVFARQSLDKSRHVALGQELGALYVGMRQIDARLHDIGHAALSDVSNVADGRVVDKASRKIFQGLGNQLWHTDGSFQKPCARYSMLHSVTVAPSGGETEFADLRAGYDALPSELKTMIEGLEAEHYALYSRINLGYDGYSEEEKRALPPVTWPLVRTLASGRKTLYLGAHATRILDMHIGEGRLLLAELQERATQREFVYRHCWQVGDMVIWDNRCTLHRGMRYDVSQPRQLRRVSTLDTDTPRPVSV